MISISILVGTFLGILYGHFFVQQQRNAQSISTQSDAHNQSIFIQWKHLATSLGVRFLCFGFLWYYYLLWPTFNFILLLIAFFGTFWLIVITKKV